jgi:hypothetical protein
MSFSNAWEVTDEDIQQICLKHGFKSTSKKTVQAIDEVDRDEVTSAVLEETDFDKQVNAAQCNIENQLIEAGILSLPKKFIQPNSIGQTFEVVVGNVGTVYAGQDEAKAKKEYDNYLEISKKGVGRAGNEEVLYFVDGDLIKEHQPASK